MFSRTLIRMSIGPYESLYIDKLIRARSMTSSQHLNEIAELSASGNACMRFLSKRHSSSNSPPEDINVDVARLLKEEFSKHNIDVVIGGSMAAMIYIPPRVTKDIDINIRGNPDTIITNGDLYDIISNIDGIDTETFIYTDSRIPKKYSVITPRNVFASFKYHHTPIDAFIYADGNVRNRVFSHSVIVDGLKFAPPECICFWKMMSYKEDKRYHRDRADVINLLDCTKIDTEWVRQQLIIHDGNENGVRVLEWEKMVQASIVTK